MDDKNYKSILMKSPFGFAYHKIIVDNQGIPVDYEFLEVNPAFESITGLKAKDIVGKTVCQVLPGIREGNFDCVQYYGDIALDGGDGEFEHYSKQLGRWYKVQAYSEQKHYFSTVFTDTTARKTLSDVAATFNNYSAQTIDLQYLADKAREISGAAYAVLNKFDADGRGSSTLAFSGMNKHIEKAISILGFDPRGKKWDYDPERQKKIDNQKTTVFQQITDLTGTTIPEKIITLISKTYNMGQVAVVKTTRETIMLGEFTLIFKRGTQLKNRETIETYADLTGMLLSRIDEERKVINEQARLKTITDNMTDLVWESDLQFINTYTSPSVNRIFGFSVEEDMPLTFEERLTPESVQTALSLLQEELEKDNDPRVSKSRSRLVELEYYKKDGSLVPLESNISFVRDKNGKPVGLRGVSRDITERKLAEEALFRATENQQILLDNIPTQVWYLTDETTYGAINKAHADFNGVKFEDFAFKNLYDIFPKDIADVCKLSNTEVFSTKKVVHTEEWVPHVSGNKRLISIIKTPKLREDGSVEYVVCSAEDITDQKNAEEKLRESEQNFRSFFETLDDLIIIGSQEGDIFYTNPAVTIKLGYSTEELNQMHVLDIHPETKRKEAEQIFGEMFAGKRDVCPLPLLAKNGSIVPAETRVWFGKWNGKKCIFGVSKDLSIQEEALQKFNKIFDSNPNLIAVSDLPDMKIMEVNKSFLQTLGFTKEEIIGNTAADLDLFVEPEKQKQVGNILVEKGSINNIELKVKAKNGGIFVGLFSGEIIESQGKQYLLTVMADITALKKVQSELTQTNKDMIAAKEKAEESDRLKSAFLANMSHEIRTPINGILGFSELLKEPELTGEQQQEYIRIIEKSGKRMLNIINDIVDISQVEAGLMKLNISESNINEQIEYIYTFFKPEAEAKGLKLCFRNSLTAKEAMIKTDREKLYAILTNLVKNAIKYSDLGTIELGYIKRNETLEFYVKDTGIGIPGDRQEAIFERFIQADIADKMARQGAGLGLSISKAYVEMLGGKIWVESEEGAGSTFYFALPYNAEPVNKTIGWQPAPSEKHTPVRKLKILIAEDDELSEMLIDNFIKIFGKEILKARTGKEAVEICRDNPDIDLILMDIRMPLLGGYEATKQIREFNKEVIIIAQTAYGLTGDREKSIKSGCNDYLAKPINKTKLQTMIQKYFGVVPFNPSAQLCYIPG